MIGRSKLSRRVFLGGAGALMTLPWLESLLPRRAHAADAPDQRFFGFYVPNGIRMQDWTPDKEGADYDLKKILEPLGTLKSKVSVITGLANRPGQPDAIGDHASGTASFLTCKHAFKTDGEDIANGVSLDQALAAELGGKNALRSLELGIDGGASVGGCDSGYSCAYARNIAWKDVSTPMPKLTDPASVFDRLFTGFDSGQSAAEAARRRARDKSVLDYVLSDANALAQKLGQEDKKKLGEYMGGVRELEVRIGNAVSGAQCTAGDRPDGGDIDYEVHVPLMMDLITLAFSCNRTRFGTFMLGNAVSNRSYGFIGVPGAHHEISHHGGDPEKLDQLTSIGNWEITQFAYLLDKLNKVNEGERTLLDNSCIFLSSDIEDGDTHSHFNMPILLAGAAGKTFKPGRHIVYDGDPSVGSLFLSIAQGFGLKLTSFGDTDKPLTLL